MFIAGRFFADIGVGIGVGMASAMIPLYQSETVPKWIRGVIIGVYQWAITIGLLLAAVVNNTTSMRNNTGSYRIPVAVQFAWSLVLCFGMLVLPKLPRFLIKKDQLEKAACSLGEPAVFHPITLP
ncbi:MFS transporter, SP family, sugar:H+ symporter [Fusarium oxysporum Fo47]|uniref:MFS transporter, SP family, sugar:H+ symporter n=1 Tax=Fusarium oxysporum Fo47 TaxID=660027 RepID=W9KYW4_FUSOX|nr:MFS transporter, SP family, sugar:H+ symporter [Fusarium oxysporum Fo47]